MGEFVRLQKMANTQKLHPTNDKSQRQQRQQRQEPNLMKQRKTTPYGSSVAGGKTIATPAGEQIHTTSYNAWRKNVQYFHQGQIKKMLAEDKKKGTGGESPGPAPVR